MQNVRAVEFGRLAPELVELSKHIVLDGLAVMVAGAREPSELGRLVCEYVRALGGHPQASVVSAGFRTSMSNAAYVNGCLAHALDFDNTWYPLNHPTSPTLPAILAIAQSRSLSGERVIEALVAAFEVQGRLRLAATGMATGKGFHKPRITGVMGATAAAIKLLGVECGLKAELGCAQEGARLQRRGDRVRPSAISRCRDLRRSSLPCERSGRKVQCPVRRRGRVARRGGHDRFVHRRAPIRIRRAAIAAPYRARSRSDHSGGLRPHLPADRLCAAGARLDRASDVHEIMRLAEGPAATLRETAQEHGRSAKR